MKKIIFTYGLIAGAIMAGTFLVTMPFHESISNEKGMLIGYTSMVLAFLLIYFGVRSYRDQQAGGSIGFGKALGIGLLIGLVASSCYVATWEVIYFGGKSDYLEVYQTREIEKWRQEGLSEAVIAEKTVEMNKMSEMYQNPLFNTAITFMEPLPVAVIMALVSAGILSRRRKGGLQAA